MQKCDFDTLRAICTLMCVFDTLYVDLLYNNIFIGTCLRTFRKKYHAYAFRINTQRGMLTVLYCVSIILIPFFK
jgi:hypothetical protein